jgi:hypothetical protein
MHAVLNLGRAPEEAIRNLMNRTLRNEVDVPASALAVPGRNYS